MTDLVDDVSPGQKLAAKREARGWSVAELAARLKYAPRQIHALESDAYGALPGTTVIRGMVRSYAKAVGMDAAPLLAQLDQKLQADSHTMNPIDMRVPIKESRKDTRLYLVLSGLVLLAVAAVVAEWMLPAQPQENAPAPITVTEDPAEKAVSAPPPPRTEAPAPVPAEPPRHAAVSAPAHAPAPGTQPVVEPPVEQSASPVPTDGLKRIHLRFREDAWVQIYDGKGRQIMSQLHRRDTEQTVDGRPPFKLVVGNVESVDVTYDGQIVDIKPYARNDVARLRLE